MAITVPSPIQSAPDVATYHAAVVHDFESPLAVEQVPSRELDPGQVRVKVEASGLCHTDIHAAHGDWPVKPSPPFVPGHEGVGIVVRAWAWRDRGRARRPRWRCRGSATRAARATTASRAGRRCAESQKNMGYSIDGAFGEYAIAYARYVVEVPDGDRPVRRGAADLRRRHDLQGGQGRGDPLLGSGRRVRRRRAGASGDPVRRDRRRPGDRGRPDRRETRAGARARRGVHRSTPAKQDPVEAIKALGGADQAIALAVSPRAFEQAYGSLRRGGTLVFVALPADNHVTLPIFETVLNGITVVGSIVGTRTDLREVFELHAAGKTRVIREIRPLVPRQRVDRRRRGGTGRRPDRVRSLTSLRHVRSPVESAYGRLHWRRRRF